VFDPSETDWIREVTGSKIGPSPSIATFLSTFAQTADVHLRLLTSAHTCWSHSNSTTRHPADCVTCWPHHRARM